MFRRRAAHFAAVLLATGASACDSGRSSSSPRQAEYPPDGTPVMLPAERAEYRFGDLELAVPSQDTLAHPTTIVVSELPSFPAALPSGIVQAGRAYRVALGDHASLAGPLLMRLPIDESSVASEIDAMLRCDCPAGGLCFPVHIGVDGRQVTIATTASSFDVCAVNHAATASAVVDLVRPFLPSRHGLAIRNFASDFSPSGSCLGIAYFVAHFYRWHSERELFSDPLLAQSDVAAAVAMRAHQSVDQQKTIDLFLSHPWLDLLPQPWVFERRLQESGLVPCLGIPTGSGGGHAVLAYGLDANGNLRIYEPNRPGVDSIVASRDLLGETYSYSPAPGYGYRLVPGESVYVASYHDFFESIAAEAPRSFVDPDLPVVGFHTTSALPMVDGGVTSAQFVRLMGATPMAEGDFVVCLRRSGFSFPPAGSSTQSWDFPMSLRTDHGGGTTPQNQPSEAGIIFTRGLLATTPEWDVVALRGPLLGQGGTAIPFSLPLMLAPGLNEFTILYGPGNPRKGTLRVTHWAQSFAATNRFAVAQTGSGRHAITTASYGSPFSMGSLSLPVAWTYPVAAEHSALWILGASPSPKACSITATLYSSPFATTSDLWIDVEIDPDAAWGVGETVLFDLPMDVRLLGSVDAAGIVAEPGSLRLAITRGD